MSSQPDQLQEWLATRPDSVQKLAAEFQMGSTFDIDGDTFHLIGYTEDDFLIMSEIDPYLDYEGAHESKIYTCAKHWRDI